MAQVQEGSQSPAEVTDNLFLNMASLPPQHMEVVYALIIHHYAITTNKIVTKQPMLPYDGSVLPGGKGILLKQKLLPDLLINILTAYLNMAHQTKF